MYQLFIVDDEEVVRKGIRELLQSAENQYAICGEASDGELALPMIQELKPDILLTDIRMPFLDGLELCEMIRAKMPWVHILILSGHDEFEYARKAVSLGVDEYILKPVTMPQLLGSLEKTARKIEEERASYFTGLDTENASARKRGVMVSHFLNELLDEVFSASDALARAEKLGLSLAARQYLICCLDIRSDTGDVSESLLRRQFCLLLGRMLDEREDILWCGRGDGFLLLLKAGENDGLLETAYETAQALKHEAERMMNASLSAGIGSIVPRLSELPRSYQDARRSLGGLVGQPHGSILSALDLEHGLFPQFDFTEAVPLAERLRHVSQEDIDFLLEHHFGSAREENGSSLLYRYYLLADLVVSSMRLLQSIDAEQPADPAGRWKQRYPDESCCDLSGHACLCPLAGGGRHPAARPQAGRAVRGGAATRQGLYPPAFCGQRPFAQHGGGRGGLQPQPFQHGIFPADGTDLCGIPDAVPRRAEQTPAARDRPAARRHRLRHRLQ